MNNIRRRTVFAVLLSAIVLTALGVSAEDPTITALRSRLDQRELFAKRGLETAIGGLPPTGRTSVAFEGLLSAIEQGSAAPNRAKTNWTRFTADNGDESAEGNGTKVIVNRRSGIIRMRDSRAYGAASKLRMADAPLIAQARPVLDAIGARPEEAKYEVHSLMAQEKPAGEAPGAVKEVARKVMVTREVAGIPVEGDHLVLSYTLDGSLRKVAGRWHQTNFDKSQFSTALSEDETVERAIKRIDDEALKGTIGIASDGNVRVRTVFVPVEVDDGEFVLVPQGRVDVPTVGPGGTLTTVLDFDM